MGNAVRRNRVRRQLRARMLRDVHLLDPARAYLVTIHPRATEREFADALSDCLIRSVGM